MVSNFIVQALRNQPITIYGDGSQTRSFCYVDDLVEGLILLMNSKEACTGPINLGNPTEFTILQLAQKVVDISGSKARIIHKPLPMDDPKQRKPDITLAQNELNWTPEIKLDDGLTRTIDYFDKLLKE